MPQVGRVVSRYLESRFKAPRGGFPSPEVEATIREWTLGAEEHGHDLSDWKLKHKNTPEYGWIARCVLCSMDFQAELGSEGGVLRKNGLVLHTQGPRLGSGEWESNACEVEPLEIVRGLFVYTDRQEEILANSPSSIASELLKLVSGPGLGKHWTNTRNRQIAQNFAKGAGRGPGIPVVLNAVYRRDDQKRNHQTKAVGRLPEYYYEEEISMGNHEVVRLHSIEWFNGREWVSYDTHDIKIKT